MSNIAYDTETPGYLDTAEFRDHCYLVHCAIKDNHGTIREIKDKLVDALNERWLSDSLDALVAVGVIEITREIRPRRYAAKEAPAPEPKRKYSSTVILRPRQPSMPDVMSLGAQRI